MRDHATRRPGALPHPRARPSERSRRLWAMSPDERAAAMCAGELTLRQCLEWARRAPEEVPRLNNEYWFIAIHSPEVAEPGEW